MTRRQPEQYTEGPAVTYSRVRSETGQGPHDLADDGTPLYDAVEVPHVDRPPPLADFDEFPSLRESAIGPEEGLDAIGGEEPRRRLFTLVAVGIGVVALAIGAGVLYATIDGAGEPSATAVAPEIAEPMPVAPEASAEAPVRSIPLTADGEPNAAAGEVMPDNPLLPSPEDNVADAPPEPRVRPEQETVAAPEVPGAESEAIASQETGGDDFIQNIESTLSRIQPQDAEPAIPPPPAEVAPAADSAPLLNADQEQLPITVDPSVAAGLADEPAADLVSDADGTIMHAEGDIFADPVVPIDESGEPIVTEIAPAAVPDPVAPQPAPVATTGPEINPTFEAGGLVFQPDQPIDLTSQEAQLNAPLPAPVEPAPVAPAQTPVAVETVDEPLLIAPAATLDQQVEPAFIPPEDIPNPDALQGILPE